MSSQRIRSARNTGPSTQERTILVIPSVPVTGTDGITRIVRSCVDGPVFRADLVRWDDVGTIPFDALGAPGWQSARTPESRYAG